MFDVLSSVVPASKVGTAGKIAGKLDDLGDAGKVAGKAGKVAGKVDDVADAGKAGKAGGKLNDAAGKGPKPKPPKAPDPKPDPPKAPDPSPNGGCFVAGTAVDTDSGAVVIEQIVVGDWVLAADVEGLTQVAIAASDTTDSSAADGDVSWDWRIVCFAVGVVLVTHSLLSEPRRDRRRSDRRSGCIGSTRDDFEFGELTGSAGDEVAEELANLQPEADPFDSNAGEESTGSAANKNDDRVGLLTQRETTAVVDRPAVAIRRSRKRTLRSSLLGAAAIAAAILGWLVGYTPLGVDESARIAAPKPEQHAVLEPAATPSVASDPDTEPHRILTYTYSEPTGTAESNWLMPDGSAVVLADGTQCDLADLRPNDRIRLANDDIAMVQRVSDPFRPRAPPSNVATSGATAFRRVIGTVKHTATTVLDLEFAGETVTATPNHPFWEARQRAWVAAENLRVGDHLVTATRSIVPIESITTRHGEFAVYNLEVAGAHNYFAGRNRVLVHNAVAGPGNACAMPTKAPRPNDGNAKPHGGDTHNDAIDKRVGELKNDKGVTNIRKNQQQADINGDKAGTNRPDVQFDKDGIHHNEEYDLSKSRSEEHRRVIERNDPNSKNDFHLLE
jgi:hypothetical protein